MARVFRGNIDGERSIGGGEGDFARGFEHIQLAHARAAGHEADGHAHARRGITLDEQEFAHAAGKVPRVHLREGDAGGRVGKAEFMAVEGDAGGAVAREAKQLAVFPAKAQGVGSTLDRVLAADAPVQIDFDGRKRAALQRLAVVLFHAEEAAVPRFLEGTVMVGEH